MTALKAPFPWFGGKSRAAPIIWPRFGDVRKYIEPFAGSLAVLLAAPHGGTITETVNDLDGFIANFWRSVASDPDEVWRHADWPVSEIDLHARHIHLVNLRDELTDRLIGDPHYCDPMLAGWWAWGASMWLAGGWCAGNGPWSSDGQRLVAGGPPGIVRSKPKRFPTRQTRERFVTLGARLRNVRVYAGSWERVLTPAMLGSQPTAILLDPPYSADLGNRDMGCYAVESGTVAHDVREWAMAHGTNPQLRIALCGYSGEHDELEQHGWTCALWVAQGGYAKSGTVAAENRRRERIWFSPHCLGVATPQLFDIA